ncbi:MAG TPA: chromosome segregation protein SMC [Ktedonobacteraceae bacterium]|nr:chromosome segregation protein SMC [Ktedonobacteraceae bacterium]
MYLKRLEMLGFKSFALRTVLEFSTGITAVVGPNGAGKSNVADAVRWVLGEQSMRQLRGKRSEDIIFSGGHGKAPLGLAEVSLTIDNSTGWVPSEYSEITVTRRSYRSGENEYLINKQKVRLKDVVLLLAQARIGHDSYTVVGQGLIDAALSLRAEERRGLFEDAAGIRPFQVQRTDAENRLRQTQQNLDRLRDIVNEIEPRLEPLAEQARRAIESRQLNSELQEVLFTWYALQLRRLRANKDRAEVAEREQAQRVQHIEQSLQDADEQRDKLSIKRQRAQTYIVEARENSNAAYQDVQRIERDLAVSQERIKGLERQKVEQQQEERAIHERLIAAQQKIIDLEEQCDLTDEAIEVDAVALAGQEAQVAKAQKEFEFDERRLRNAQSELIQIQARLGASQSDLGRQQKHLGERNRTLAARRETISQTQQSFGNLEMRLVDERAQLDSVRKEEQHVTQRRQVIVRAISDAQQEIERLKTALTEAERLRRSVSDRLNMLKNWRSSLSGYSDGVRALLHAPTGKVGGIIGPVPQLGIAPAGLETALEAALGPYLQGVVVQTFEDAHTCLDYLSVSKAGKAMVVWLEGDSHAKMMVSSNNQMCADEDAINQLLANTPSLKEHIHGLGWSCIQCEQRYMPLFHRMLRGIVIVDDLRSAETLFNMLISLPGYNGHPPIEKVITRNGEVLHLDGWLSGGSGKDGSQQGLLTYERELHELPQQLEEHKVLIDKLNTDISKLQRSQESRRVEQNAIDKELQKNTLRVNDLSRIVNHTQREQERLQTELQLAISVEQQLSAELSGLEQEVKAALERVHAHEKSQREVAGLVEELQREVEERTIVYRRKQDEMNKARTALAVKRHEAKSLRQQLQTQQTQVQDLKLQVEQYIDRMAESEERHQSLQEMVASQRAEIEQAREHTQKLAEKLHDAEMHASEVDGQITTLEHEIMQLRHTMTDLEVSYRRSLLESQKARDAVDALLEQLHEETGVMDPAELIRYATNNFKDSEIAETMEEVPTTKSSRGVETLSEEEETYLRKLRRRVDNLRNRLKAIGGSDPDAPQQYEETRTRYEFLCAQIADMDQAALQLHTIISQLDVTMARQFEVTFQSVNARFSEHFTTLFNGGNARLELITSRNEENGIHASNMPAGVDVIVQPPGKKVQDLSLLSGGERALVSAALLFALLEINPPPFCLLDEVDAALDESNLVRFCEILKRLAQRTQFIVITHNRVTMMEAQVIYGVSMGGDSVSRLLSMKLEEASVAGDR